MIHKTGARRRHGTPVDESNTYRIAYVNVVITLFFAGYVFLAILPDTDSEYPRILTQNEEFGYEYLFNFVTYKYLSNIF
jgi:hypothetical protein